MADTLNQLKQKSENLINRFADKINLLKKNNPDWNEKDIRVAIFGLPANRLVSMFLNLKMIETTLLNLQWWDANITNNKEFEKRQRQTDLYVLDSKVSYFVLYFSSIESQLRQLVTLISPGSCSNGFAAFKSIYDKVFNELSLQRHTDLYDFARCIRNLIHNNGTYIDDRNQVDKTIVYKGQNYRFEHGKKINFAYQELLLDIMDDLFNSVCDVVEHSRVMSLVSPISRD